MKNSTNIFLTIAGAVLSGIFGYAIARAYPNSDSKSDDAKNEFEEYKDGFVRYVQYQTLHALAVEFADNGSLIKDGEVLQDESACGQYLVDNVNAYLDKQPDDSDENN